MHFLADLLRYEYSKIAQAILFYFYLILAKMRKRSIKNKPAIFRKRQEKTHCPRSEAASPNSDDYFLGRLSDKGIFSLSILPILIFLTILSPFVYSEIYSESSKVASVVFPFSNKLIGGALAEEEKDPIEQAKINKVKLLENQISQITRNTPMEKMSPAIAKRDQTVAAFLVGIALKESKFGIYSPKKEGRDCYNYWGYRGRENPTASGYSCFDTPEQAVEIVGNRLEKFVQQGRNTPAKMTVWKCGYSCAGHSDESVKSWINDVSINFYKLNQEPEIAKK